GTEGRFSAAGNWDRQPVSGRGDALIFPAAGTYENDLGEISVRSVTLSAGGTLTGGAITLTADGDAFVSDGALTVDSPLVFSGGGTERIRLTGSAEKVFSGAIALADGDVVELSAVGTVRFKGGVSGPGATLDLVSAASYYFENKPLAVRRFLHTDGPNYPYAYVYLKAEGNAILERPGIRSMHIWVQTANAFTEDTVLGFADNCYKDAGVASINFNGNSTVADRIQSPVNMNYQDYSKRREGDDIYSKKAMTLTLKGSNDASAYSQMGNELSLIWDPKGDYTQCFIDRTNSMTGSITVKGGCLKMSGTCTFAFVPEIEVQNGARFEAAVTNTGALAGLTKLTLKGSGRFMAVPTAEDLFSAATVDVAADINSRIVLPQGTALSVKTAVLGGAVALAAGTYTGIGYGNGNVKECALIEGSGTLTVAAAGSVSGTATVWTGAESAAWENVGNWSDGLPSVEKKSFVHDGVPRQPVIADSSAARIIGDISFGRLFGNSVSVSVSGAADFSGGDFKIGDGATLDIASTGCFTWNAASRGVNYLTETSSIDADGTFRSAGSVDLDMTGRLAVRGLFSATAGRVTIKGSNGYSQMMIERGGRFEATGETVVDVLKTGALDAEDGGEIAFSGKAVLNMPTYWKGIELGSADLTFTDNAQFVNKTDSVIYFCPKAAGESFHLLVRGSAQANLPSVEMKGHKDGSIVEIDYGSENVNSIASIVVGADYGTARLRQRCGELTLGGGLTVSGGFVSFGRDTSADSEVFVTGGKLTIGGSSDYTAFN
ncbi:MAG: hypothetical protein IKZ22_08840, partial [Kiritimatiellae bacterium]|nr:hypothetical protein [Kiritimatiellia bacterium]